MSWIKEKYRQFRRWQQEPFEYHDTHDLHGCCNCGRESDNNYCPRCGQKAAYGPITWRSVWQGLLDVWGMGTRSLPYTLWQLLWRPGYLMRDYIGGKRQVCFPPIKMLVILAVIVVLFSGGLDGGEDASTAVPATATRLSYYFDMFVDWMAVHLEWAVLLTFSFFIIPVWFLFREGPGYRHHSLPQGFYIQVLASAQILLLVIIIGTILYPMSQDDEIDISGFIFMLIVPAMLFIDFKQLFGYGWWGTLWRVAMLTPVTLLVVKVMAQLARTVQCLFMNGLDSQFLSLLVSSVDRFVFLWFLLELIHLINIKEWRNRRWLPALCRPLLALIVLLLAAWACHVLDVETSIESLVKTYRLTLQA